MLPLAVLDDDIRNISGIDKNRYEWAGFAEDKAEYVLYDDDGISKNYTPKEQWMKVTRSVNELDVTV